MKPKTRRSNIYRHQTEMDATKMERERDKYSKRFIYQFPARRKIHLAITRKCGAAGNPRVSNSFWRTECFFVFSCVEEHPHLLPSKCCGEYTPRFTRIAKGITRLGGVCALCVCCLYSIVSFVLNESSKAAKLR